MSRSLRCKQLYQPGREPQTQRSHKEIIGKALHKMNGTVQSKNKNSRGSTHDRTDNRGEQSPAQNVEKKR